MRNTSLSLIALSLLLPPTAAAEKAPSFVRDVKPFLGRYCVECHNPYKVKGGLQLDTYKGLMEGGKTGPVVLAGKPDESRIVLLAEGKEKPFMPPEKVPHPRANEVAVLRAWVAAGARDDSATVEALIPDIKPRQPLAAPVAALAYHPDGKVLAAGSYQEVLLLDPASSEVIARLPGQTAKVTALAFSPDGRRLAVASGAAGKTGEIRHYTLPPSGAPSAKPDQVILAHADAIYDLTFRPDGNLLASCSYDRLIKLWDPATGKEVRTLKDHSDSVYGLAFSPDGQLLASAAADRAVKVWDVATGKRLYTLGEATDWVYAVAWAPSGKYLAAAGVDRSIRVWEVSHESGRLVHSVFAHEGPVTRLVYSADEQTLYSLSEDRVLKAWDTVRMVERRVYPRQAELPLSLAVRPDHKQLAVGRYDGSLVLLDEATGQTQSQPLPVKPKPPQLSKITPNSGIRGQVLRLTFEGKDLDRPQELTASVAGVVGKFVPGEDSGNLQVDVTFPADTSAGVYQLGVKTAGGPSAALPFTLDLFPQLTETEPNDSATTGQKIALPASIAGSIGQAGDVDFYRFDAKAGDQVGVQVLTTAIGSKLEPILLLTDASGQLLAESSNGVLGYACPQAGTYALGIRDRDYRGGADMPYRLHVGDIPVVTSVFPLGLQRGTEAEITVQGVYLGDKRSVKVKAPPDAAPGSRLPVPVTSPKGAPLGNPTVVVGEFPEVVTGSAAALAVPGTANGRLDRAGAANVWTFSAKKGQRLIVEINARRLGSPLDSSIEILDSKGQPVPRATLRCLAKTYTTFRDHDSAGSGIRLETWSELAMNDYLYVGSELIRILELPKNPDDDCRFFNVAGQRVGFLDTTPTFHSLGTPMYKVSIHPPGTTFPPNGLPVITLSYRNDDGGPGYGKDSRLFFDVPADGEYQVRVSDARGQGGSAYAYRLTVRPPAPTFNVSFTPTAPAVWKGGALPIAVTAERKDGFSGPIAIQLENLPPGFHAPITTIPAEENSTSLALFAEPGAMVPSGAAPLKLVARATIDGREEVREVVGSLPKVVEPGDIVTTTDQAEVTVRPGQEVRVTVTIERRHDFKGRVPLEVRGLPHGVHVLDIGLNGILVTENQTTRTFVIRAEPWVQPTEHPFVVLARREGKNTEHAARSLLLKVVK